jgi:TBC1 domain family protein 5
MSNSKFPQYKKNPKEKCIEQFNSIFIKNLSNPQNLLNNLKENSMSGEIEKNYIRSTSWNILLKTYELDLNITDTKQNLKSILLKIFNNRKKYKKKLKEITSLKKFSGDPLGGSKENDNKLESWNSFFDQGGIKHIISIDIDRTYQDVNLFLENSIKEIEKNVLYIWAKENKSPSYKQGMNDILAVLIYALYPFYFTNTYNKKYNNEIIENLCNDYENNINEIYDFIHDENEFESDLFFLFSNLMKFIIKFYEDLEPNETKTKLIKECNEITHEKLKIKDPKLYEHFNKIELDIEIVMQRWLKCLLSREFKLEQIKILWDAILADNSEENVFNLVDYISLAMIVYIRNDLIKKDQNQSFQTLFKYPEIDDPLILINLAIKYRNYILDPNRITENEEEIEKDAKNDNNNIKNEKKEEPKINKYDISDFINNSDEEKTNNNSNNNNKKFNNYYNNNNNNSSFKSYNHSNSYDNNNFNNYNNNNYNNYKNNNNNYSNNLNNNNNNNNNNYNNNNYDYYNKFNTYEEIEKKPKKSSNLFAAILDKTKNIINEPFKSYKKKHENKNSNSNYYKSNNFETNNVLFQNNNNILTKKEKLNEIKKILDKYKHLYNINDINKLDKLFNELNQEI